MLAAIPPIESKGHSLLPEQTFKKQNKTQETMYLFCVGIFEPPTAGLGSGLGRVRLQGTFTLFTYGALVAVGPDAATAVALWVGIQQQLFFPRARACF